MKRVSIWCTFSHCLGYTLVANVNIFAPIKMINDRSIPTRMCEIGCLVMLRQIQVLFRHFNYTSVTVNTLT